MHVSVCVCTYLMVTANQKSVSYTDTHTRKESKHNTRNSHQITRDESKRRERNKKDPQKQTPQSEQNDSIYLLIISLNVKVLNTLMKIYGVTGKDSKQDIKTIRAHP